MRTDEPIATVEDFKRIVGAMSPEEKAQVLQQIRWEIQKAAYRRAMERDRSRSGGLSANIRAVGSGDPVPDRPKASGDTVRQDRDSQSTVEPRHGAGSD